jgi:hypothetical protein
MARRTTTYAIRLAVEGGGQVKAELVSVGQSGEQSRKRIEAAGGKASGGLKGLGRQAELLRTGIRTLGGALVGAATVGGLGALIDRSISAADAIGKTADKIGVGVEALQELRFAAKASGVEQQTLDMALQRFTRRAAEAAQGTGEAKDALAQMGIALRDQSGNLRRSEDLLGDVADAFAPIEDPAERVRLAFSSSTGDHPLWLSSGTTPNLRQQPSSGGTVTITSSVAIGSTLVGTWRPGRLKLYVDGWPRASSTATATNTSVPFGIYRWGWGFSTSQDCNGDIALIACFASSWIPAMVRRWHADAFGFLRPWNEVPALFGSAPPATPPRPAPASSPSSWGRANVQHRLCFRRTEAPMACAPTRLRSLLPAAGPSIAGAGSSRAAGDSTKPRCRSSGRSAPLGTTARSSAGAPITSRHALAGDRCGAHRAKCRQRTADHAAPAVSPQPAVPTGARAEPGRESSRSR